MVYAWGDLTLLINIWFILGVIYPSVQGVMDNMKFAKGHSKILMKNEQASALDVAREKVLEKYAIMLQRLARGFIVRRRLLFMRKVLKGLHEAIRKRSDALLAKWFAQVSFI